jgi:hypothetical protein
MKPLATRRDYLLLVPLSIPLALAVVQVWPQIRHGQSAAPSYPKPTKKDYADLAAAVYVRGDAISMSVTDEENALYLLNVALYHYPKAKTFDVQFATHDTMDFHEGNRYTYDRSRRTLTLESWSNGPPQLHLQKHAVMDEDIHELALNYEKP